MSCNKYSTPNVSVSALNTVKGAGYYANYSAKHVTGTKCQPKKRRVTDNTQLNTLLEAAYTTGDQPGITMGELGDCLRKAGVRAHQSFNEHSPVAYSMRTAIGKRLFNDRMTKSLATRIGWGQRHALLHALKQYPEVDQEMFEDLQVAADSKQGITKAELKAVVVKHLEDDGPRLTDAERNALKHHVASGSFARAKTEAIAKRIANGEGVSILGIRTV